MTPWNSTTTTSTITKSPLLQPQLQLQPLWYSPLPLPLLHSLPVLPPLHTLTHLLIDIEVPQVIAEVVASFAEPAIHIQSTYTVSGLTSNLNHSLALPSITIPPSSNRTEPWLYLSDGVVHTWTQTQTQTQSHKQTDRVTNSHVYEMTNENAELDSAATFGRAGRPQLPNGMAAITMRNVQCINNYQPVSTHAPSQSLPANIRTW